MYRFVAAIYNNRKEIALETGLFANRLLLDIAAFDKVTTNQMIDVQLSGASGYTASRNRASLYDGGLDILPAYIAVQTSDRSQTPSWNNT